MLLDHFLHVGEGSCEAKLVKVNSDLSMEEVRSNNVTFENVYFCYISEHKKDTNEKPYAVDKKFLQNTNRRD